MAAGWGAWVEGKATSLRIGSEPWSLGHYHTPLSRPFLHHCLPTPRCPQTSPSPVTSRWPEGQRTGISHWKDIGWLTGTQCAWWLSHDTLFPFLVPFVSVLYCLPPIQSCVLCAHPPPLFLGDIFWLLLLCFHPSPRPSWTLLSPTTVIWYYHTSLTLLVSLCC